MIETVAGYLLKRRVALGLLLPIYFFLLSVSVIKADDFDPRDLQREVMVRKALAKDPRLQPLNLVVRVQDRVATLSGPVPSRELARRALETAKKLPELRDVQDRMMVQFEDATLLLALPVTTKPAFSGQPSGSGAGVPTLKSEPVTVKLEQPQLPTAEVQALNWKAVNPDPNPRPAAAAAVVHPNTLAPSMVEAVSRPREIPGAKQGSDTSTAVQNLMQADERYRRLRYEMKQGKVYLNGAVSRWSDLEDLAKALTRVPGVEGVVISDVKTGAPRS